MIIPNWHDTGIRRYEALFRYDHLPPHLQEVSRVFHDAAQRLVQLAAASGPELDDALRKLWEAKNSAVVHIGFVQDMLRDRDG
jgi:hypothetical protein